MTGAQITTHRQAFDKVSADLDTRLSRLMTVNEQVWILDFIRVAIYN